MGTSREDSDCIARLTHAISYSNDPYVLENFASNCSEAVGSDRPDVDEYNLPTSHHGFCTSIWIMYPGLQHSIPGDSNVEAGAAGLSLLCGRLPHSYLPQKAIVRVQHPPPRDSCRVYV